MKLKLTKKERAYFAEKGREGGKAGDREAKAKGGKKGGKSRMAAMTPEQRSELASKAGQASALARWRKRLKAGDAVVVRGRKAVVFDVTAFGVMLDRRINGVTTWDLADLTPPKERK